MARATDDERREVAERLRDVARAEGGPLGDIGFTEAMHRALGGDGWRDMTERLADLIEPSCDRDALLALADELEEDACWEVQTPGDTSGAWRLKDACDRIREALEVES